MGLAVAAGTCLGLVLGMSAGAEAGDDFAVPIVHTAHGPLAAGGVCGTSVDCAPLSGRGCAPSSCSPCGGGAHAHGSSWSVLRSRLTGKELIRSMYLRRYFLRRYPFRQGRSRYFSRIGTRIPAARGGINRHGITRVDDVFSARDGARAGINRDASGQHGIVYLNPISKAEGTPDAIDILNRGMARFHWGEYKLASQDFDAVLASEELPQARYGRLLCAVIRSDWDDAAADLARLARANELRRDDRLLVAEIFRKANAFPSLLQGLKGYIRYRGGSSASLVAAWALMATGQEDEAAKYLRRASQALPDHPAVWALQGTPAVKQPAATPTPKTTAPIREADPVRTAPRVQPASPFQTPLADRAAG